MTNKKRKKPSRKAAVYKGTKCLNCGHSLKLSDKYCPNCSQINSTKQLSIVDFFNEFFSSIFTYDSRLRYTLKDLLFKPGIITKNYVAGQRLKYANPFRFFLSISFIYFILQGLPFGNNTEEADLSDLDLNIFEEEIDTLSPKETVYYNPDSLETVYYNPNSLNTTIDSIIKNNKPHTDKKKSYFISEKVLDTLNFGERFFERITLYHHFYKDTKIKDPNTALDSLKHSKSFYNKWLYNKNEAIERVSNSPKAFFKYLTSKIPFFLFFFAPFYALFFWLIYSRKKYNYMEHLIFIFHIFSFVFLVGVLSFFPDLLLGNHGIISTIIFVFIGPWYFYKALRNFYEQSKLFTLFKFTLLNIIFFIGSTITAILFFSATAAFY